MRKPSCNAERRRPPESHRERKARRPRFTLHLHCTARAVARLRRHQHLPPYSGPPPNHVHRRRSAEEVERIRRRDGRDHVALEELGDVDLRAGFGSKEPSVGQIKRRHTMHDRRTWSFSPFLRRVLRTKSRASACAGAGSSGRSWIVLSSGSPVEEMPPEGSARCPGLGLP